MSKVYATLSHMFYWNFIKYKSRFSTKNAKILVSDIKAADWRENLITGFNQSKQNFELKTLDPLIIGDYDCVVPLGIDDLIYADEIRHLILDNPYPVPSKRSVELCDNKILFNREFTKNGFKDYIPRIGIRGTYPYILKRKIDVSGKNSHIIYSAKDEKKVEHLLDNPDYFTQKIIPGRYEYATHILFKDQKILKSLNIKYTFNKEMFIKGQYRANYTEICRCPYLDIFTAMLQHVGFEGICCVNYKVHEKRPMIIEINPRVGFSLSKYLFSFVEEVLK